MSVADDKGAAAAHCADVVRSNDFSRYVSTLFLPAEQRRALLALYAFNVEITRVRDHVTQSLAGEVRMQWWADMLVGQADGGVEGSPVASELLLAIRSFNFPVEAMSRLIEEHQFDLYNDPMPSMAALEGYVQGTSSALFTLGARVAAPPSPQIEQLTRYAGLAQGFVRVIGALPYDAARRQLFLPEQVLETHGSTFEEVFVGKQTPPIRAAVDQLLAEARQHLGNAFSLLADVPPEVRPIFLPLAWVRRELSRMSRADNDPFVPQAPSRLSTLWTLWQASKSKQFKR